MFSLSRGLYAVWQDEKKSYTKYYVMLLTSGTNITYLRVCYYYLLQYVKVVAYNIMNHDVRIYWGRILLELGSMSYAK